jgi:hypothetical protein
MQAPYSISDDKIIIDFSSFYCETPEKLLRSALFEEIVCRFLKRLEEKESPIFRTLSQNLEEKDRSRIQHKLVTVLRLLNTHQAEEIVEINERFASLLNQPDVVYEFIEGLYNYWRTFERYIVLSAPETKMRTRESIHHAQFIRANETLRQLVLRVYRTLCENLIKTPFRVYRQLPAGAHVGLMTQHVDWKCPAEYKVLQQIPFVRLALLEPPVIFYPKMNVRSGIFREIQHNPIFEAVIKPDSWFCYPAKIGKLLAFAYFHKSFMSQGLALANLFELANYEDLANCQPDIILLFGSNAIPSCDDLTMFYEDKKNKMMLGYEVRSQKIDYFGYMKKMLLTLHNIIMLERGLLPVHGAMVSIRLKSNVSANIVIVGDSGAGKSETLEAFRLLAKNYLTEITVIFDDMGSIEITEDGRFLGYGTEIGAFLRLDDLQPGYAFEQMDRSIFMNPNLTNARVIVPVTSYKKIVSGVPIDFFLYANNYEAIEEDKPAIEMFASPEEALPVFNQGKRMAKGTTSEQGMTASYFANPFGAPQRRPQHEELARHFLEQMYQSNIAVGQLRTQLGIKGMERKGPQIAAKALFSTMAERFSFRKKAEAPQKAVAEVS